jgi:Protein of unknown function (DUF3048) N-terminal domain/Protein of unknown function (DUF3048) C-terminal domain
LVMTRRGKMVSGVLATLLVAGGGAGGYLLLSRDNPPARAQDEGQNGDPTADPTDTGSPDPTDAPPAPCPLTGEVASEGLPDRPALAIKVEDAAEARPQAGLNEADIIYEQPVEGNITRLIVIYHCQDSDRVGPVRSARFMDPNLLPQFNTPLFGYSGAAREVVEAIEGADLVDLSFEGPAVGSYARDPEREMPHNLFTSTQALHAEGEGLGGVPDAVFAYSPRAGRGEAVASIHLPFNESLADVFWRWNQGRKVWLRFHGEEPHVDEAGVQVAAANVVVQMVDLEPTEIKDAAGNVSFEVIIIGSGDALIFRNGKMIEATWRKDSPESPTRYFRPGGRQIALAPGTTWVELFGSPNGDVQIEVG